MTAWDTYVLNLTLAKNAKIVRFHISMLIFDQFNIESSNAYAVGYGRLDFGNIGGFFSMPSEFMKSYMIGFVDFEGLGGKMQLDFVLDVLNDELGFGAYMDPISVSDSTVYVPMDNIGFNYFYLKGYLCPTVLKSINTFLNSSSNMCELCTIQGCLGCNTLSMCSYCDNSLGLTLNYTALP